METSSEVNERILENNNTMEINKVMLQINNQI